MLVSTKGVWPPFAFSESSAWGKCLESYLQRALDRSGSQHTLVKNRQILGDFFSTYHKAPDEIVQSEIEAFMRSPGRATGRIGRSPGPGLQNNRLSSLRSFYSYAAAYGITGQDGRIYPLLKTLAPTANMRALRTPRNYKALSTDEVQRLFAQIPRDEQGLRDFALYSSLLFTARRISEILNLRYGDITQTTLEDGSSITEFTFRGKGHKGVLDVQELPPQAWEAITHYLVKSGRREHMDPDSPIFVANIYQAHSRSKPRRRDPLKPLTPSAVWASMRRYARLAGLSKKVHPHVFRHTSARMRFKAGEGLQAIQHLLRHENIATTSRYIDGPYCTTR
ncbi:MAG TPA: hypothetical protein DCL75_11435 [Ktedonobacter sp.]|nr:hypothetical protein [Ktedonobacter sp.]